VPTTSFSAFAPQADDSLLEALLLGPQASGDGHDHRTRQVFSIYDGPVTPSLLPTLQYGAHSSSLFQELQAVCRHPCNALSPELEATDDRLKPRGFFNASGVSH
jgi:hypothetical protein